MNQLLNYSWKDIEHLDKEKTILFITVAPIEEHSLHLPIGVDIKLGMHWQKMAIEKLETTYPDYSFISMPFLPLAAGSMKTFPGCMYIKPRLLRKLMVRLLTSVAKWGINKLVVIASHGDPLHNIAIEKACNIVNKKYCTEFISPMGAFFSYNELDIDIELGEDIEKMLQKYPHDYHAGWVETSMMLDISPNNVRDNYRNAKDIVVTDKDMIRPSYVEKKTQGFGHLGYPQYADKDLGQLINASTSTYLAKVTKTLICKKDLSRYTQHFLHKFFFMKMLA